MNFNFSYAKFRGSKRFLLILTLFVIGWLISHFIFHTDQDFGALNVTLSIEASLSVALLMMDNARAMEEQKKQLEYMVELSESLRKQSDYMVGLEEAQKKQMQYMVDLMVAIRDLLAVEKERRKSIRKDSTLLPTHIDEKDSELPPDFED